MGLSPTIRPPHSSAFTGERLDVIHALTPLIRAIGLRRIARYALLGFAAGAAAGACVLVAARIHSFPYAVPAAILAAVLGTLAGGAWGMTRWPRTVEAARRADLHFGLDDRLTTALELQTSDSAVAHLQNIDVARQIDGLALARGRGRWIGRNEGAIVVLAAAALAGALVLGSGTRNHAAAAPTKGNTQRTRHAAAAQVQKLANQLHLGLTPGQQQSAAMRQLNLALSRLRRQLLQAPTTRTALRSISATQQQLHQIALGLHPVNSNAVAQLNSSLAHYLTKQQTGQGQTARGQIGKGQTSKGQAAKSQAGKRQAGKTGKGRTGQNAAASARAAQAMAQELKRLAQVLAHLTPAQRAALAQLLGRSANANSASSLRSLLRQAASSLANNDQQSAGSALQQAAQALAQSSQEQAALSRLGTAGSQLDSLKNQLSGTSGQSGNTQQSGQAGQLYTGSSGQGTGQKGSASQVAGSQAGKGQGRGALAGQGQGKGRGAQAGLGRSGQAGKGRGLGVGQGRGTGFGRGTRAGRGNGRGQGQGRGSGQGQGASSQQGQGRAGAHGSGGQGQSNATRAGKNVTVYIPGKQGKGPQTILTGPNGAPEPGALVPYQEVVGQYAQSAHQSLDRSAIPPSLQGYVRRYFSSISH